MKRYRTLVIIGIGLIISLVLSGCSWQGNKTDVKSGQVQGGSKPSTDVQSVIRGEGAAQYEGTDNLAKYQATAKANPNNPQDQFNAGVSAFVNKKFDQAIQYYKLTIKLDPKNGMAYNSLANIYLYTMKDPKTALPYYTKATETIPNYAYAWLNKSSCEKSLGDKAAAQATLKKGLATIPASDSLYLSLKKALTELS